MEARGTVGGPDGDLLSVGLVATCPILYVRSEIGGIFCGINFFRVKVVADTHLHSALFNKDTNNDSFLCKVCARLPICFAET